MSISGFSYIRNGFEYDYPFLEAIKSILPVCDEVVIAVGDSLDGTRDAIAQLHPQKIKIIDTVWDMSRREGGRIFAQQADIALDNIKGDWAFHIQADEVIHENDLPKIITAIKAYENDSNVEGFILPFLHFWGGYNYIRDSRRVHKNEVRLFRNDKVIRSYLDSQGFRKYGSVQAFEEGEKGEKLMVKKINAPVYHYNGVRRREVQEKKDHIFNAFHHADLPLTSEIKAHFDYQNVDRVVKFTGTHPEIMKQRIDSYQSSFVFDPKKAIWKTKDKLIQPLEDLIGFKIGEYRNYKLLK